LYLGKFIWETEDVYYSYYRTNCIVLIDIYQHKLLENRKKWQRDKHVEMYNQSNVLSHTHSRLPSVLDILACFVEFYSNIPNAMGLHSRSFFIPRHSKNGGGALSVTPVRASVRPSVIKIWRPLNNFWKTASIQFKFGMLIYNIKTQVEFDLDYNPLIFDRVMGLL